MPTGPNSMTEMLEYMHNNTKLIFVFEMNY